MQVTRKLILGATFALCTLTANLAQAGIVVSHGTGTSPYTGRDSKGVPVMIPSDEQAAIANAELNAIEMYYAKQSDAATDNYDKIRDSIASNLPRYVLQYDILNEQRTNTGVTVDLKATLNGSLLNDSIKKSSATSATVDSQRSLILFVFVARQVDSTKTFDARIYKRADTDVKINGHLNSSDSTNEKTSNNGNQGESISASRIAINDSKTTETNTGQNSQLNQNMSSTATTETGGSTTERSSQSTWRLYPSANLNSSITSVLSSQGYEVVDESEAEANSNGGISIKEINNDYSTGQDLQPKTLNSIKQAAKTMGIRYVILGTMDMDQTTNDPASLNPRVDVTVNVKAYDLSGRFARQIVVVGPVQYSGLGPTESTAQTQALKNAGEAAAKEVVSQMQNLELH